MNTLKLLFISLITIGLTMCDSNTATDFMGNVEGQIRLKGADINDNGGILIEILYTSYAAITGPSGSYTISNVPIGQYTIRASYPNYISGETHDVTVEADHTTQVNNFVLEPIKGVMTGQISLEGETDYTGIMVNINNTGCLGMTDENGNFTVKDIPIGKFTLIASMPGYINHLANINVEPGDSLTFGPIELMLE